MLLRQCREEVLRALIEKVCLLPVADMVQEEEEDILQEVVILHGAAMAHEDLRLKVMVEEAIQVAGEVDIRLQAQWEQWEPWAEL